MTMKLSTGISLLLSKVHQGGCKVLTLEHVRCEGLFQVYLEPSAFFQCYCREPTDN